MKPVNPLRVSWRASSQIKLFPYAKILPLLRSAAAQAPNRIDLQMQLVIALFRLDRMAELVELFRSSVADKSSDPRLLYYTGRAALAIHDLPLAHDALRLAATKGVKHACGYLAETLQQLGEPERALTSALAGLERWPSDYKSMGIVATALLQKGELEQLWTLCAALFARGAWGGYLPSAMALAATKSEQFQQIESLIDWPRWFCAKQLAAPAGFNEGLTAELLAHKSLAPLPSTRATIGTGQRVDHLELFAGDFAQELLDRICETVEAYVAERQDQKPHPMIVHQPDKVTVSSWALSVRDDGHETWHIHPSGWLSGVYYVQIPEMKFSGFDPAGAIEFGPYPFSSKKQCPAWPTRCVEPQAGLLLLFPSYYGHKTWPTGVGDSRVCVAFDVTAN
jgi:uncharacterized protein (TIGR02466 family)